MDGSIFATSPGALAAAAAFFGGGWIVHTLINRRRAGKLSEMNRRVADQLAQQRDSLAADAIALRARLKRRDGELHRHEAAAEDIRTQLESAREREKRLGRDLFTLRSEREDFKTRIATFQNALTAMKRQAEALSQEFVKSREFYKGELRKSFAQRLAAEQKLQDVRAEHQSFTAILSSAQSEQESASRSLAAARTRLARLDELEAEVIRLEAENAELRQDAGSADRRASELQHEAREARALRARNRELAERLEAIEKSPYQQAGDVQRYHRFAEQTEWQSESLQIRLDEVEESFAALGRQQHAALCEARRNGTGDANERENTSTTEVDDLKQIVGIGKVFERALNDLGVFSFRQLAAFGAPDIAHLGRRLKQYRGRAEYEDWVGQAKALYAKKSGGPPID